MSYTYINFFSENKAHLIHLAVFMVIELELLTTTDVLIVDTLCVIKLSFWVHLVFLRYLVSDLNGSISLLYFDKKM